MSDQIEPVPIWHKVGRVGPFDDGADHLEVDVVSPDGTVHVPIYPPDHRAEYDESYGWVIPSEILVLWPHQAREVATLLVEGAERAERIDRIFDCLECGMDTRSGVGDEIYLVHDELWEQFGPRVGCLCIGCLEIAMGRRLRSEDFKDLPINRDRQYQSARLRDRLGVEVR